MQRAIEQQSSLLELSALLKGHSDRKSSLSYGRPDGVTSDHRPKGVYGGRGWTRK